jgi:hypothetical protein
MSIFLLLLMSFAALPRDREAEPCYKVHVLVREIYLTDKLSSDAYAIKRNIYL